MAKLTTIEFESIPNLRVIGIEVSVSMEEGKENPVAALWQQSIRDGTIDMLTELPLAIENCLIGWMGEAVESHFVYIVGVAVAEDTPVPEGMQYRDLSACKVARGTVSGNLQNGDVYGNAHTIVMAGIEARGFRPDYSSGWNAELYPANRRYDAETGGIDYLCPYTE